MNANECSSIKATHIGSEVEATKIFEVPEDAHIGMAPAHRLPYHITRSFTAAKLSTFKQPMKLRNHWPSYAMEKLLSSYFLQVRL